MTKNYDQATKIVVLVASYLLDHLISILATVHCISLCKTFFSDYLVLQSSKLTLTVATYINGSSKPTTLDLQAGFTVNIYFVYFPTRYRTTTTSNHSAGQVCIQYLLQPPQSEQLHPLVNLYDIVLLKTK